MIVFYGYYQGRYFIDAFIPRNSGIKDFHPLSMDKSWWIVPGTLED